MYENNNDGMFPTNAQSPAAEAEAVVAKKYLSLDDILGIDNEVLAAVAKGEFETEKLGIVPFSAIDYAEYKQAKKDCIKFNPDGTGGVNTEIDDDKLMVKIVIAAVGKDTRSDFTFASKALLDKLSQPSSNGVKCEVRTAEGAVAALLSPGEVVNFAVAIQNLSGFGKKKSKENADAIKN